MEAGMPTLPYPQLCHQFSLDKLRLATHNFDDALVVGEGGFGKVYKATICVENGATFTVAIKRLDSSSHQGATEFWAEIEMLTSLRHCNLVSLIGYCNDNSEMILIYEFMPHGTLNDHLHKYGTNLSWVQRLKISIGAARGLQYLHTGIGTQHGIIHRDVKSSNILLDKDYAAKISDFGLSKIGPTNTSGSYVNTLIKGTFGYIDPEYFLTGRLTRKTDVFAFGVVLFELLCGRKALDRGLDDEKCSLAKWAHESIKEGKVYNIIDIKIKSQISPKCLKVFVDIANRCLSSDSKKRPTMAEMVVALEVALTCQNKSDSLVKPAAGILLLSFARMIKWSFISPKVNSAQSDDTSTINEDTIEHCSSSSSSSSSSKEDSFYHGNVAPARLTYDPAQTKYLDKNGYDDDHVEVYLARNIQTLVHDLKKFSYVDLKNATRKFTQDMSIGGGKFGEVFEGWIDAKSSLSAVDGLLKIAIKRFYYFKILHHLKAKEKFLDMTLSSKVDHPNIVKVLGYCFEDKRFFLIYEFMENGSLDSHLFTKDKIPLPWRTRVQIAKGIAEALSFLHKTQNQVQTFSIKIHQILLDKNFNAKISDFESAKLLYGDSYREPVFDDPLFYHPFAMSDVEFEGIVHSFGLILFQILTGKRIGESGVANLLKRMWIRDGEYMKESLRNALDPRLPNVDDTTVKEAMKFATVAFGCTTSDPIFTLNTALDMLRQI